MLTGVTGAEVARRAVSLVQANPYGFLLTVSEAGQPRGRLVQHLAVDDDATIWIGTSPRSRKAADLVRHADVSYAVEDRGNFAYAAISGTASLIADEDSCSQYWEEGLRAFFPDGPSGQDFVLIRIICARVEVVDFAHGIHPDPYGLVAAVAVRRGAWELEPAERRELPGKSC
jgi:general stress protein 26